MGECNGVVLWGAVFIACFTCFAIGVYLGWRSEP